MKRVLLTIGGSDPSAGAGIQSDIKTFREHGFFGVSVITALTVQNTKGVFSSFEVPSDVITSQLKALFSDFPIKYAKTGMLSSDKVVEAVYKVINKFRLKLVIDPVIFSKNRFCLLKKKGITGMIEKLFPVAYVVTPNLHEAEMISGVRINSIESIEEAAIRIRQLGPRNVIIKGGHFEGISGLCPASDILYDGKKFYLYPGRYIKTRNTHGTGCVFSASLLCNLAGGFNIHESVRKAKEYLNNKFTSSQKIGKGFSPVEQ
ncbi:MAG: bifunctional hydroxymethylpyrimidine kinase/phosphomethylpyrimidine kinase [Ignavibacteria bacterium]|nr:bifunctional hydroxymethylpyrimidine kinase/phosphomethylpyrimidine kinase [Ignavibacteria bacterium]